MILKKFPCHFEKFKKDETKCQWLNKEINRSKRKMYFNFCSFNRLCPTHKLVLITFLTFAVSLMSWISLIGIYNFYFSNFLSWLTTSHHRSRRKYLKKQTTVLFNYVPWIVAFWTIAVRTIVDLFRWFPAFHLQFW